MKKGFSKICALILAFLLVFFNTGTVFAQETQGLVLTPARQEKLKFYIKDELNSFAKENGLTVSFDNVNFQFDSTAIHSEEALNQLIDSCLAEIKNEHINLKTYVKENDTQSRGLSQNGSTYTAKVESMIPAIGWGYINQDFTTSVSSGKIQSINLVGSSYDTGFTLGTWSPNYSWYTISNNKNYAQINMKGQISYLWDLINITSSETFLSTVKGSGSKLINSNYLDWPD